MFNGREKCFFYVRMSVKRLKYFDFWRIGAFWWRRCPRQLGNRSRWPVLFRQDFTLDFYFRQFWTDPRLAFRKRPGVETLSVGSEFIKNIWVPDTFFVNEKQSYFHIATTSNEFIRIHHSGSITRSIRWVTISPTPEQFLSRPLFPQLVQLLIYVINNYFYNIYNRKHSSTYTVLKMVTNYPKIVDIYKSQFPNNYFESISGFFLFSLAIVIQIFLFCCRFQ